MHTNTLQLQLCHYVDHLYCEEKSKATRQKYLHDAAAFCQYVGSKTITKELVVSWKRHLIEKHYAAQSINSMLAAVNSFLTFIGKADCRVKSLRLQRQAYTQEEKELTKEEYYRLVQAAKSNPKLQLILQTICSTGIRVSELQHFTVEGVAQGSIGIQCKSKTRTILIPKKLQKLLLTYAKKQHIHKGRIFITRSGKPMDRSNIWAAMKHLCQRAGVSKTKVFPHNLRKLFARAFYGIEKDIAKLADILGHSSIDTTRIYIMSTGAEHRKRMESLHLLIKNTT